jgi:hypothetical protein
VDPHLEQERAPKEDRLPTPGLITTEHNPCR